jgi:hypothetical protein
MDLTNKQKYNPYAEPVTQIPQLDGTSWDPHLQPATSTFSRLCPVLIMSENTGNRRGLEMAFSNPDRPGRLFNP